MCGSLLLLKLFYLMFFFSFFLWLSATAVGILPAWLVLWYRLTLFYDTEWLQMKMCKKRTWNNPFWKTFSLLLYVKAVVVFIHLITDILYFFCCMWVTTAVCYFWLSHVLFLLFRAPCVTVDDALVLLCLAFRRIRLPSSCTMCCFVWHGCVTYISDLQHAFAIYILFSRQQTYNSIWTCSYNHQKDVMNNIGKEHSTIFYIVLYALRTQQCHFFTCLNTTCPGYWECVCLAAEILFFYLHTPFHNILCTSLWK